jgi:UDP-3-O-[3-hydroxymyristoyl] N-acetylglucosamine deacetylase
MLYTKHAQTLSQPITVSGCGLHSNKPCSVTLCPTEEASGIVFHHLSSNTIIPALANYVKDCNLATTLAKDAIKLQTVEHLLSALAGLDIDHLKIELTGEELPILDGSAAPWVHAIQKAGIIQMISMSKIMRITKPIEILGKDKWIRISPYPGLRVDYAINFNNKAIGHQKYNFVKTPENYILNICAARTFCMEQDITFMRSVGLAKGGSLDNAVVFGPNGPLNSELRFTNEAVRHKVLDLIGDLKLIGAPIQGHIEAFCAGHAIHVELVKNILTNINTWTWEEDKTLTTNHSCNNAANKRAMSA